MRKGRYSLGKKYSFASMSPKDSNPSVYRHRRMRFWHENGVLFVEAGDTNGPKFTTDADFLERASGFQRQLKRMQYRDEREEVQSLVEDMVQCIRDCRKYRADRGMELVFKELKHPEKSGLII